MPLVVGPVTIEATAIETEALRPTIENAVTMLGSRIKPFTLITRERDKMPLYSATDRARGFWRESYRRMIISKDLFPAGLEVLLKKTVEHELIHVLFSDHITAFNKAKLMPLLTPAPEDFNDLTINGAFVGYGASPEECIATWGSAALFEYTDNPAYSTLYKRRVYRSNFPALKTVMLASAPVSADPCAAMVKAERDAHEVTKSALAATEAKLVQAKKNAQFTLDL